MNYAKNIIAFGEVLWDILPQGRKLGGAPFNFSYRMHSLGHHAQMVSRIGRDKPGDDVLKQMQLLGMDVTFIQTDQLYATGTVNVVLNQGQPDFHIVEEAAYDYIHQSESLINQVKQADCFYFGTLVQRAARSRQTLNSLIEMIPEGCLFLDLNLRKNCYSPSTVESSLHHASILKLNDEEVQEVSHMLGISGLSIPSFCEQIMTRYGIDISLVTLGEKGVFAMTEQKALYCPGYQVIVSDTVGSGDAFSAGFLHQWLQEFDIQQACEFGNALGALVATQTGATDTVLLAEIGHMICPDKKRIIDSRLSAFFDL